MKRLGQVGRWVRGNWRRLAIFAFVGSGVTVAYSLGRSGTAVPEAAAVSPVAAPVPAATQPQSQPALQTQPGGENYAGSAVAIMYDGVPITRQEFGEYLIARQSKRLDQLINKRIIEHYCQQRGVTISDAEVDAAILEDLGKMAVTPKQFLEQILSRYNMTFYEWREDVVRPQLMMKKVVRNMVSVTADDLKKAYEAEFGEKRDCRIIIWPKSMDTPDRQIYETYDKIRKTDAEGNAEFERAAKAQPDAKLGAGGGRMNKPISRFSLANPAIEEQVFRLKEGEVSVVLEDGPNLVVFKCDKIVPPVPNPPPLESRRDAYVQILTEAKIRDKIPEVFKEVRAQAKVIPCPPAVPEAEKEWLLRAEKAFKQPAAPAPGTAQKSSDR